jgi:hypothetical protein
VGLLRGYASESSRHPPVRMAAMVCCKEPDCSALVQGCFKSSTSASVFLRPGLPSGMARRCSRFIPVILEMRLSDTRFSHSRNCGGDGMAEMFDAIFCSDVFRRCRIKLLLLTLQYAQVFAFLPAACDSLGEVGCGQPVLLSNRAKK